MIEKCYCINMNNNQEYHSCQYERSQYVVDSINFESSRMHRIPKCFISPQFYEKSKLEKNKDQQNLYSCFHHKSERVAVEVCSINEINMTDSIRVLNISNEFNGVEHVYFSEKFLNIFRIPSGSIAYFDKFSTSVRFEGNLSLEFKSAQRHRNWDEYDWQDVLNLAVDPTWPRGLPVAEVERILPLSLLGCCFVNRQKITANLLDLTLIFCVNIVLPSDNIDIEQKKNPIYILQSLKDFTITIKKSNSFQENEPGHVPPISLIAPEDINQYKRYDFSRHIWHHLMAIGSHVLIHPIHPLPSFSNGCHRNDASASVSHIEVWKGPRTAIIAGPEGAGKSYLLNALHSFFSEGTTSSPPSSSATPSLLYDPTTSVIQLSLKHMSTRIEDINLMKVMEVVNSDQLKDNLKFLLLLKYFLQLFTSIHSTPNSNLQQLESIISPLLILVDDLDEIFDLNFISNSNEISVEDSNFFLQQDSQKISYYCFYLILKEMLRILTSSSCGVPVVIICTTRRSVSTIPRAFSVPPGFELVLEVLKPSRSDRENILRTLLRHQPSKTPKQVFVSGSIASQLETKVDPSDEAADMDAIRKIAAVTPGYLPGDLADVVRLAKMIASGSGIDKGYKSTASQEQQQRQQEQQQQQQRQQEQQGEPSRPETFPSGDASQPSVVVEDLLRAMDMKPPKHMQSLGTVDVIPSTTAGAETSKNQYTWEDYAGYPEVKEKVRKLLNRLAKSFDAPTTSPTTPGSVPYNTLHEKHTNVGRAFESLRSASEVRGIVLHGPPGNGKTFLARVIASEATMNFITVRTPDILSRFYGQTEATIRDFFARARAASPCVLFFDDFDSFAYRRSSEDQGQGGNGGLEARILSTFLNEVDGISSNSSSYRGVLVLTACASLESLDEALLRPGRLQHHIYLGPPTKKDVISILNRKCAILPVSSALDLNAVADLMFSQTKQPCCADVDGLILNAVKSVVEEAFQQENEKDSLLKSDSKNQNQEIGIIEFKHFVNAWKLFSSSKRGF